MFASFEERGEKFISTVEDLTMNLKLGQSRVPFFGSIQSIDHQLLFAALAILSIGLVMIYSASISHADFKYNDSLFLFEASLDISITWYSSCNYILNNTLSYLVQAGYTHICSIDTSINHSFIFTKDQWKQTLDLTWIYKSSSC